ncbi:hypothetical protein CfE428DRAFT_0411 [Chthoniobacter flavus Ellin428]|uniref:Transmembrane protein n=1 Tax=Chthoniobacter flavus Ellin428 TaxID=497964 RepID=B4CUP8_9BACT|nr:hypothetical protein CfE428DRAFT_0411 [Chthoniobacter flavus Ellin428]TCO94697.1 hypothetical protein EV701_102166 [Chthoniobacter flavus]
MATIRGHFHGPRSFFKEGTHNGQHLFLCLFTLGLWTPIWFLSAVFNAFQPFHCHGCGRRKWR